MYYSCYFIKIIVFLVSFSNYYSVLMVAHNITVFSVCRWQTGMLMNEVNLNISVKQNVTKNILAHIKNMNQEAEICGVFRNRVNTSLKVHR